MKVELPAVYNVPVMVPGCDFMTKWFDHKVYLPETEAGSVSVRSVEKIAEKHELSEALVNMGIIDTEEEPEILKQRHLQLIVSDLLQAEHKWSLRKTKLL